MSVFVNETGLKYLIEYLNLGFSSIFTRINITNLIDW